MAMFVNVVVICGAVEYQVILLCVLNVRPHIGTRLENKLEVLLHSYSYTSITGFP